MQRIILTIFFCGSIPAFYIEFLYVGIVLLLGLYTLNYNYFYNNNKNNNNININSSDN